MKNLVFFILNQCIFEKNFVSKKKVCGRSFIARINFFFYMFHKRPWTLSDSIFVFKIHWLVIIKPKISLINANDQLYIDKLVSGLLSPQLRSVYGFYIVFLLNISLSEWLSKLGLNTFFRFNNFNIDLYLKSADKNTTNFP